MEKGLRVCVSTTCLQESKRYSAYTKFCRECGEPTQPIQMCCAEEELHDNGFCRSCGAKKQVVWADPAFARTNCLEAKKSAI